VGGYVEFAIAKYAGNLGSLGFFSMWLTKRIEDDANPL
jgi:hypothetical protein